jgi:hypothetical protein
LPRYIAAAPVQHEIDEEPEELLEEDGEDESKGELVLSRLQLSMVYDQRSVQWFTLRGVTTDQRMAERRRERSQKNADRIRMITCQTRVQCSAVPSGISAALLPSLGHC